jgi:hypothetical protein
MNRQPVIWNLSYCSVNRTKHRYMSGEADIKAAWLVAERMDLQSDVYRHHESLMVMVMACDSSFRSTLHPAIT